MATIECDHENTASNFCPHCGAVLKGRAIDALMRHVSTSARPARKSAVRWAAARGADSAGTKKKERIADKWESWALALADLIAESAGADTWNSSKLR